MGCDVRLLCVYYVNIWMNVEIRECNCIYGEFLVFYVNQSLFFTRLFVYRPKYIEVELTKESTRHAHLYFIIIYIQAFESISMTNFIEIGGTV